MQLSQQLRTSLIRLLRATLVISLTLLGGLVLVCVLVLIQGQRDEVRATDALLLAAPQLPEQALINHTLALYRQGYATRIILAHPEAEQVKTTLTGDRWRLPESSFIVVDGDTGRVQLMRAAAEQARAEGIQSVVITSRPGDMLLELKMAQDFGFNAYGSPAPELPMDVGQVFRASVQYWQYVFLGR